MPVCQHWSTASDAAAKRELMSTVDLVQPARRRGSRCS
jgi:hypothetical protein